LYAYVAVISGPIPVAEKNSSSRSNSRANTGPTGTITGPVPIPPPLPGGSLGWSCDHWSLCSLVM
jgi:hypothetical protein